MPATPTPPTTEDARTARTTQYSAGASVRPGAPRPIPLVLTLLQAVMFSGALAVMMAITTLTSNTWPWAAYFLLMYGAMLLGSLVRRRFLGGRVARSGRQTVTSFIAVVPLLALVLVAESQGFTTWGVLAMLGMIVGITAILRYDDVTSFRRAREGHFAQPTATGPHDVDGPTPATSGH
ncbi:hypothetical protein Bra3105_12725 [Brachybacterium halotolerans subsp. kimchii]|uniref:hypothetical protein n=1 Tax=Brachybacterium halotolerans TaxID=2795215 RepID=UPI001E2E95A3|nr:hypothetical protein [Brachybacterium halotolerans]UEJ81702.1 hypothetical protein Bra3105_12725 [Brachybacterium halotolerans subsp. kimchii]